MNIVFIGTNYSGRGGTENVLTQVIKHLAINNKVVFYKLGELEYRSLRFETEEKNVGNYQGNAVINYTEAATPSWSQSAVTSSACCFVYSTAFPIAIPNPA